MASSKIRIWGFGAMVRAELYARTGIPASALGGDALSRARISELASGVAHGLGRVASNAVQGTHVMPAIAIVHIDDSRPARRVAREHGHIHVGAGSQHASHHMAQRAAACYRDIDGS